LRVGLVLDALSYNLGHDRHVNLVSPAIGSR